MRFYVIIVIIFRAHNSSGLVGMFRETFWDLFSWTENFTVLILVHQVFELYSLTLHFSHFNMHGFKEIIVAT